MKIVVLSVEGEVSNTEINYYNGLSHHLTNVKLQAFAIGKTSNNKNSINRVKNSIKNAISMNDFDPIDDIIIYFIGDGDRDSEIPSMIRSIEVVIPFLKSFFKNPTIHEQLIKDDCSFEAPFGKLGCKSIYNSQKRGSNVHLFNNVANELEWFENTKLNFDKMINDYENMKTNHINIMMEIKKYENN